MATITRSNAHTAGRALGRLAMAGVVGLLGYKLIGYIPEYRESRAYDRRREMIETALTKKDFDGAQRMYDELAQDKLLRPEDAQVLESQLNTIRIERAAAGKKTERAQQRTAAQAEFDGYIARNELDAAATMLPALSQSANYSAAELNSFSMRVEEFREPNLAQRLQTAPLAEKMALAETYLQRYPSGSHHQQAIAYLLIGSQSNFAAALTQPDGHVAYAAFAKLHSTIATQGIPRDFSRAKLEDLLQQAEEYLTGSAVHGTPSAPLATPVVPLVPPPSSPAASSANPPTQPEDTPLEQIALASVVRPIRVGQQYSGDNGEPVRHRQFYLPTYIAERDRNFPLAEATGMVVDIRGSDVYVRFDGAVAQWKTDWPWLKLYWADGKKNVAVYKRAELKPASAKKPQKDKTPKKDKTPPAPEMPQPAPASPTVAPPANARFESTLTVAEQEIFLLELHEFRKEIGDRHD